MALNKALELKVNAKSDVWNAYGKRMESVWQENQSGFALTFVELAVLEANPLILIKARHDGFIIFLVWACRNCGYWIALDRI